MSKKHSHYMQYDLIIILILFISISLLGIFSAEHMEQYAGKNFVLKQAVWYTIGIGFVVMLQFPDLDQLKKASPYIYAFSVILLFALFISPASIAEPVKGAKSWFNPKGLPLSIQPSEFGKIAFILFLAATISKHKEKYELATIKSDIMLLGKIIGILLLPIAFISQEADFGSSMVYVFIAGVMILVSGINWKIIFTLILGGTAVIAGTFWIIVTFPELSQDILGFEQYQIDRVLNWFDPTYQDSDTYQFDLSIMALGSGQLFGKGIGNLEVYIPEAHSDFIYSIIGETFGFVGSSLVILLYFILLYRLLMLGLKTYEHSKFGAYICFGYLSLIFIHTFQNIGMIVGVMPITGIPLLLLSYGGSSILATMIGFGLIYRVAVEQSIQDEYLFK
ncbi:FtsW/RodA/SpoVE family cell cycle protein [Cerasibacillus terrae]|uniref:FtsW/RodA/SpoVE family cell cycle protein n=1 Tax=Cerasibacillus terrae TaxID=2498845 RepID=A0A5C8NWH6_9BACI|nr:FtsW/RodA/SpoVE family cell cycle protein [Cerasibacillus terrae]